MRTPFLTVGLLLCFALLSPGAWAVCNAPPTNPENDCDEDGYTIQQGDCDDAASTGAQTYPGAPELCDGKNNNCDSAGLIDEGLAVDADTDGVRQCGTCGAPAPPACDCDDTRGSVKPGQAEVCDGLDNDCNGQVDDQGAGKLTQPCYSGPAGTEGVGLCHAGTQSCDSSTPGTPHWSSCAGEVVPSNTPAAAETLCDSQDNDCDGTADDGLVVDADNDNHRRCGTCGAPAAPGCDCNDGNPAIRPGAAETCDNVDQDCDGSVDDMAARACFEGANVTPATYTGTCPGSTCQPRGECRAGTQTCSAGAWSACGGTLVLPAHAPAQNESTCDSKDNDCDGTTDEGLVTDADGDTYRRCGTCGAPAAPSCDCNDGNPAIRPGATEICDNVDQDCDGSVDDMAARACFEGANVTSATYTGTCPGSTCQPRGECRAGTQSCSAGAWSACGGTLVLPAHDPAQNESTCDDRDNDCDGTVDDGLVVDADLDHHRRCGTCGAPAAPICDCNDGSAASHPGATELCDNLDNDCDGLIDEGFDEDHDSYLSCAGCSVAPCDCNDHDDSVFPTATELCDCIDQDCDGNPANGFPDADGDHIPDCPGTAGDCDDSSNQVHGAWCNYAAVPDTCDGRDNDCDGRTDKTSSGATLTQSCFSGPGTPNVGICRRGTRTCNATVPGTASWTACSGEVIAQSPPEQDETLCDNRDEDCDGSVDDGLVKDQDGDQVRQCGTCNAPAAPSCDCNDSQAGIKPGLAEQCDGVDQNCDGQIDNLPPRKCFEGANVTPDTHTGTCPGDSCSPKGECRTGTSTCQGGVWSSCGGALVLPANAPDGLEATCDGKDNDCDGTVDDGQTVDADEDHALACGTCLAPAAPSCDCNDGDPEI
ncbi:MAG: putative metal-binding motif-containing protein, partial [Deltaproteobacteria bacterium]|nr:putative metal-binding motif-containing protein [Deltaproteobacteria bacterium]